MENFLRPHQQVAFEKIMTAIRRGDTKMAIIMATATGKTRLSIAVIRQYLKE